MAKKSVISVRCPCCKEILEVDVEQERVLAHRKGRHLKLDAREDEDGLDVAVRQQKEHSSDLESRFQGAQDRLSNQKEHLQSLFDEARRKAATEEPDEDPDNPFKHGKIWD